MQMPERWNELSPLLDEFLDLSRPARDERLREIYRGDRFLAKALEGLLCTADSAEAADFLSARPPLDAIAAAGLVGSTIGPYTIEAELGSGGTGSVWRARRLGDKGGNEVAIKLLHLSLLGRSGAARFEREGAILGRLVHPNVARLLGAGGTPQGQPYLVIEYVDGSPIDQHCDANRLDVRTRLRLLRDVMSSVMQAHAQLIIHRDIKPNNILVTADGTVKLLDFGIAKLIQDDIGEAALTLNGQSVLTPRYAAPEQLQGEAVTTATDVYALGVLMYRLLSGRYPTASDDACTAQIMQATLKCEPSRLDVALKRSGPGHDGTPEDVAERRSTSLPNLRRELSGDLNAIVNRALQKRPGDRYESVRAFARAIDRYLDCEPPNTGHAPKRTRFERFQRGNRPVHATVSLILASAIAGFAPAPRLDLDASARELAARQLERVQSGSAVDQFLRAVEPGGGALARSVDALRTAPRFHVLS